MKLHQALRRYEELEVLMADLYHHFGRLFAADPKLATAFARLHAEELSHRDMVRFQMRLLQKSAALLHSDTGDALEVVEQLIQKMKTVVQGDRPWSPGQAVKFAVVIERDAGEYHCRASAAQTEPGLAALMSSLGRADRAHCATLQELEESLERPSQLHLEGTITAEEP